MTSQYKSGHTNTANQGLCDLPTTFLLYKIE